MNVCKFRVAPNTKRAIFEITNKCNLNCPYCVAIANQNKNDLSTKEIFTILDKLKSAGFTDLKITGGEPFIRKDIIEILNYASKNFKIDVSTNALLLTPETMKALSTINLDMIHISLDGIGDEHELFRGKGTFKKTVENIKQLRKATDTKIRIGTVIHNKNISSISDIVKLAADSQVDKIVFSFLEPRNKIQQGDSLIVTENSKSEITNILEMAAQEYPEIDISYNWKEESGYATNCLGGSRLVYINSLGQVSPCSWSGVFSEGSLIDESLEKLLSTINKKGFKCYDK